MKADLYIQGHYVAALDVPGDSLLAILARGITEHAAQQAKALQDKLNELEEVRCTITLTVQDDATYTPEPGAQLPLDTSLNKQHG